MVPVVARFARGERAGQTINVIIALGAAGALVGIVQYAMLGYDNDNHRPMGSLSHYMTYSGVLMLVTCAAAARLLFYADERIWPAIAVPALLVALVFTRTRNAWIGIARGDHRPARHAPAAAAAGRCRRCCRLFLVLAPASLKQRAVFDRRSATTCPIAIASRC